MIRKKLITIIKIRTKVDIKLNSKRWNWKKKYSKQNIYNNQKFEDQIWYNQQIIWYF
jgi:hypothetical protein